MEKNILRTVMSEELANKAEHALREMSKVDEKIIKAANGIGYISHDLINEHNAHVDSIVEVMRMNVAEFQKRASAASAANAATEPFMTTDANINGLIASLRACCDSDEDSCDRCANRGIGAECRYTLMVDSANALEQMLKERSI